MGWGWTWGSQSSSPMRMIPWCMIFPLCFSSPCYQLLSGLAFPKSPPQTAPSPFHFFEHTSCSLQGSLLQPSSLGGSAVLFAHRQGNIQGSAPPQAAQLEIRAPLCQRQAGGSFPDATGTQHHFLHLCYPLVHTNM